MMLLVLASMEKKKLRSLGFPVKGARTISDRHVKVKDGGAPVGIYDVNESRAEYIDISTTNVESSRLGPLA